MLFVYNTAHHSYIIYFIFLFFVLFLRAVVREAFSILYRFNDHFPGKIFKNIADFKLERGVIFVKTGS